jgi:uncharacterized protein YndB with AHSA1/START domain
VGIRVSREIAAPARRVWELLADWERQGEWIPVTTVRTLPGQREGVGTRIEAVTGLGPARVVDPMEVISWEPPRRYVTRHLGQLVRGTAAFEVEPLGPDRCRFTWTEDLDPGRSAALRTAYGVLGRAVSPFFSLALWRLGRIAER